jgi:hypothetical protein
MSYNDIEGFLVDECDQISCSTTQNYYPRGAGTFQTVSDYYWYGKLVAGNDDILADPSLVIDNGETFWLTGLFKWMVSLDGRPSPHSIMTGSWVPNTLELSQGLTYGFGAVIALYHGETECSLLGNTLANARTSIYEELID